MLVSRILLIKTPLRKGLHLRQKDHFGAVGQVTGAHGDPRGSSSPELTRAALFWVPWDDDAKSWWEGLKVL